MAFVKYAHSKVVQPNITFDGWEDVRAKEASFNARTASKVVFKDYDPDEWLLSHCTIVASVDTEDGPGNLGKSIVDGFQIDRRFSNYLITPTTTKFVNNNHDAWDRPLLQQCYRTFVGGENYVEHLQIKEMSKGKIIDAAARDIGDSLYVDILVATQRKYRPLVAAISSGQLKTLSMGCFLPGTQVTMADGTRVAIEDVAPGDMVLTHKGRTREVLNKQIRIGRWNLRKIDAVGIPSRITATENHPFFVLRAKTHCACGCGEELKKDDRSALRRISKRYKVGHDKRVFNPNNTYSLDEARERLARKASIRGYTLEEVRADELKIGDYLCFPRIGNEFEYIDQVSPGKARLLGFFVAEGSFLKRKGEITEVQFNFSLAERNTFAQEVVELLAQEFDVAAWVQEREDRSTCTVHAHRRDVAEWFKCHGGEYASTKRLSFEAFTWPVEIQRQLVGGWLDGDGGRSVRTRGGSRNLSGATTSYNLACQMHAILTRIGVFTRIECRFGGQTVEVSEAVNGGVSIRHPETGKLASFNLVIGARQLKKLGEHCRKAFEDQAATEAHLRVLDDIVVFPVTSIESMSYQGEVHDMEVDEDHSYVVEGVAVHNCTVTFTQCTRCGNVAEDESQLCPHIRYFKGSKFYDDFGKERKIAELCGHKSDPGSVKFIEASWVANPAFTGAVLRNILSAEDARKMASILSNGLNANNQDIDPGMIQKVATLMQSGQFLKVRGFELGGSIDTEGSKIAQDPFDFGTPDSGGGGDKGTDKKDDADPLEKVVNDIADAIRERALEKVRGEIGKGEAAKLPKPAGELHENDSIIKSALRYPHWRGIARSVIAMTGDAEAAKKVLLGLIMYRSGGWKSIQASRSFTGKEILAVSRVLDFATRRSSMAGEGRIYSVVVAVGGLSHFRNVAAYLSACRQAMGRDLTKSEGATLIAKGRLYALGTS